MTIEEITNKAKSIATNLSTHFPTSFITVRFAAGQHVAVNGPVTFGHDHIVVPVSLFCFSSFKERMARVVLNRDDLTVKRILR